MSLTNNNPGNLKHGGHIFQGETGTDSQGFAEFDSIEDGYRAMAHNLSYYFKKGRNTVRKIVTNWSRTDQQPYMNFVSSNLGVSPDDILTPGHDEFYNLMLSMSTFELGDEANEITDQEIEDGLTMAENDRPNLYAGAPSEAQTNSGTSNTPAKQGSQPGQTPGVLKAGVPTIPKVADVMKTAGFGQGAIDWFAGTGFGWIEVGIAGAIVLLILRPFD